MIFCSCLGPSGDGGASVWGVAEQEGVAHLQSLQPGLEGLSREATSLAEEECSRAAQWRQGGSSAGSEQEASHGRLAMPKPCQRCS